jgi:hypothetical protein
MLRFFTVSRLALNSNLIFEIGSNNQNYNDQNKMPDLYLLKWVTLSIVLSIRSFVPQNTGCFVFGGYYLGMLRMNFKFPVYQS